MAQDAIPIISDQIQQLPSGTKAVDLLVVSAGGDPMVAWRVMSLLRDRVKKVGVIVPQAAFSAATMLALGADEIVMHPCGNLGPVDPQIQVRRQGPGPQQEMIGFGTEDLAGFLEFVRENVGLSDQEHLKGAFDMFCKEVGAVPIGVASRSARLSLSLSVKLLQMHMKDEAEKQKAHAIAETLNKEFFHHGYPVGRKEAKEIGLKVIEPKDDLEKAIWGLWENIESELESRNPFNPMTLVAESGNAEKILGALKHVEIPINLPPQMAQQIMQQILSSISVVDIEPVEYTIKQAIVESTRLASVFSTTGRIFARRDWEGKISVNNVPISGTWRLVKD